MYFTTIALEREQRTRVGLAQQHTVQPVQALPAMACGSGSRSRESTGTSEAERRVKRRRVALELDTLECPICFEPLAAPVYQCNNGHTACAGCHKKLGKGLCPACFLPIGRNRCTVIEKVIESLRVPCKYAEYGCEKMLEYCVRKRDGHEDMCEFVPYRCPVTVCKYEGPKSSLPEHFVNTHSSIEMITIDVEDLEDMRISFILSTDYRAYDKSRSQYVIVQVFDNMELDADPKNEVPEDQGRSEVGRDLFLIHHQYQERLSRYSFSVTSFGHCNSGLYRIKVNSDRDSAFRDSHIAEGPIHDNQGDHVLIGAVRDGRCLFVPKVGPVRGPNNSMLEVEFQLM